MTDRSRSAHEDHRIAAVERRLRRMSATTPPPLLRRRVLGAIDDVLAERRPAVHAAADSRVSAWAWAAALVAVPLVTAVTTASWPLLHAEPLTLAARLRAASVADEQLLTVVVGPPSSHSRSITTRREAAPAVQPPVRPLDFRRIPEELL